MLQNPILPTNYDYVDDEYTYNEWLILNNLNPAK